MIGLENPLHLAILFVVLLLIFGAKRLPEMGRSLGSGLRGFKEAITGESREPAPEVSAAAAVQPAVTVNGATANAGEPERPAGTPA